MKNLTRICFLIFVHIRVGFFYRYTSGFLHGKLPRKTSPTRSTTLFFQECIEVAAVKGDEDLQAAVGVDVCFGLVHGVVGFFSNFGS